MKNLDDEKKRETLTKHRCEFFSSVLISILMYLTSCLFFEDITMH